MILLVTACSGGDGGLCDRLDGVDFQSAEAISEVEGPEGIEPSFEFLEFRSGTVDWFRRDIVESGDWACDDDRVTAFDGRFVGELTDEDGQLVLTRGDDRYLSHP